MRQIKQLFKNAIGPNGPYFFARQNFSEKNFKRINLLDNTFPVFNASGPKCTSLKQLEQIAKSESDAIMMKSCTLEPRYGNPKPRYADLPHGAIQAMGLPNLGYKKYIKYADKLKKYNKPIIASIAGLNFDEYIIMMKAFQKSEVKTIEVNLS